MAKRTSKSFPAEYLDIWLLAADGDLRLEFPTRGHATNKKKDLYTYRRRLADEGAELGRQFFEVDLLVEEIDSKGVLSSYVPDWKQKVREKMRTKNFQMESPVEAMQAVEDKLSKEARNSLEDTLTNLGFTSEKKQ